MNEESNQLLRALDNELELERNARAELAWQGEPRSAAPLIEQAVRRELPPGHIAFLGNITLWFQAE